MEGRAHRQQHAALGALGLGHLDGALDGCLVAAHHDLPAAIVVGDGDDLAERRLLAGLLGRLELDAEQGRHRADADRHRLLHRLAAQLQKPRGVCELQGAGGGQGRIFPQRMAGDVGRQAGQRLAAILLQDARDRDADRHQRRLGVLGQDEVRFRPFPHQFREVLLQRLVDLLEDVACRGEGLGKVGAHADGLGSLSRKDERTTHGPISPVFGLKRASSYPTRGVAGTP